MFKVKSWFVINHEHLCKEDIYRELQKWEGSSSP